jgi:hypothetical protein
LLLFGWIPFLGLLFCIGPFAPRPAGRCATCRLESVPLTLLLLAFTRYVFAVWHILRRRETTWLDFWGWSFTLFSSISSSM